MNLDCAHDTCRNVRDLEALLEISRHMVAERDLESLMQLVLGHATDLLDADRGSLFIHDQETGVLWTRIAQEVTGWVIRVPVGVGLVGHAAATGELLNVADAYSDPRFNREVDKRSGYRTRSILTAPFFSSEGDCTGVLQVLNKHDGGPFTEWDEELLRALGAHLAVAIENARLHEELDRMLRSLVRSMAAAIDARDPVTAGHSERVTAYALNIADAMGLGVHERRVIEYASALHDVGKLGVPDHVLLKPGRFTPDELSIMREHAGYTERILGAIEFPRELRPVPEVASSHHERPDGLGYPDGRSGGEIGLLSRILAVADVYDALVSYDRPYKRAMSVEEALDILREGKGTQFDPDIVDIFERERLYQVERRQYQRCSGDISVEFAVIPDARVPERVGEGRTVDMSGAGLGLLTGQEVPAGTWLDLEVHLPSQTLTLLGQVMRTQRLEDGGFHAGVRFVRLPGDVRKVLDHHLRTLEPPALL